MARMPGVEFLGVNTNGAMSQWDIVCAHTIVGFQGSGNAAHFTTGASGKIVQARDTNARSAANLDGNWHIIAIENEDFGPAYGSWSGSNVPRFTAQQAESIARIFVWCHQTHGIPLELVPDSKAGRRGIAYHRQGIDGNFTGPYGGRVSGGEKWSSSFGKVCLPTDTTEVLTERGWLPLLDVRNDDRVASWSPDSNAVTFDHAAVVEPYVTEVVTVGGFESTPDHEWVVQCISTVRCSCGYSGSLRGVRNHAGHGTRRGEIHQVLREHGWKRVPATDLRSDMTVVNHVQQRAEGLPISTDQVRLMAWFQADGHIMRETRTSTPTVIGVEWHLSKLRKIVRLREVLGRLGIAHKVGVRKDGTTTIRVYGDEAREKIIRLLPDKSFTWDMVAMSSEQAEALWEEAAVADGDVTSGKTLVFSTDHQSMDVLQAVGVLNGKSTTSWDTANGLRWVLARKHDRRLSSPVASRVTEVACLTTVNGTLIIRQRGKVVVTGNCPGDRRIAQLINEIIPRARVLAGLQEDDVAWTDTFPRPGDGKPVQASDYLRWSSYNIDRTLVQVQAIAGALAQTETDVIAAMREIVAADQDTAVVVGAEHIDAIVAGLRAGLPAGITKEDVEASVRRVFADAGQE
jgi:hypothetical protein